MVTGGGDGRAVLWDAATRRQVSALDGGHGTLLAARYARDTGMIALGFEDGTVLRTDPSLRDPQPVGDAGSAVQRLAVSADGRRIVTALSDGSVRMFSADRSEPAVDLGAHRVVSVDMSSSGDRVVTAGKDGTVALWNRSDGRTSVLHRGGEAQRDVAVSSDGEHVVAVGDAGVVRTWDLASGRRERAQKVGTGEIFAAAFSPDGRRYAAGNKDGAIWVWNVAGGPRIELRGQGSRVYDVGFGPTNDRLVSAGDDGTARIWDVVGSVVIKTPANGIDVSSDGRFVATSNEGGTTRVWETATGRLVASLKGAGDWTTAKFSPKNDTLVLGSDASRDIRFWHLSEGGGAGVDKLRTGDKVGAARFDPTGKRLVYVDMGGTIIVRSESGTQVTLRGGQKLIYDAQFSPDGKQVAAIGEDADIAIWRVDRPDRPERILKGHRGHVNSFTYARDGRLASAGADGTIRVWNTSSGAAVVLQGHASEVTGVTFTRDGRRVLSTSFDATVRMWDSHTGVPVGILQSGASDLLDVQLTPDGKIVTQGMDNSVSISECEVCGSLTQVRAQALDREPRQLTADERRRYLGEAG